MAKTIAFLKQSVSSPLNALITVLVVATVLMTVPPLFTWAITDAVWSGTSSKACANPEVACWLFIRLRFDQILFGSYPADERWRPILCAAMALGIVLFLTLPSRADKALVGLGLVTLYPVVAGILLRGGILGLVPVPTRLWGGLMLTLVIAAWTIATALPLGLLLALARRSSLPVASAMAVAYIDIMRGLPLVGVLFLAVVLFPLFVPPGMEVNPLVRVLAAFTLFNAAIMAEVFRGGIQSVPKGQYEAANALGLPPWRTMLLIVLPQAARAALPGIVNVSIAIMKETTIVLMAGMFDFLGVLQNALIDPEWLIGDQIRQTAYFFAGTVFFVICFGLSRYSAHLDRKLGRAG